MEVVVRRFGESDCAQVIDLWHEVFPNEPPWNDPQAMIRRKSTVQPDLFLVGEVDGVVVATVMAGFDGVRGWIHHLAVASSMRRRGIATRLMEAAEEKLAAFDCPKVNLQIRGTNPAVVAFYRRVGYEVEEMLSMGKRLHGHGDR